MHAAITDWTAAYDNRAAVADTEAHLARWSREAAQFRAGAGGESGVRYGEAPRNTYDLFQPEAQARGLVVFIHGGYWRTLAPGEFSHLAAGPLAHGWAVAMPGYTLAPEARIADITREVATAITAAAARVPGPLRLIGHSAGGHLALRMVCDDAPAVANRIERVLSVSGVHDLRPLLRTEVNDDLHLDAAQAASESPALRHPMPGASIECWAGADELPEFRRQNALMANIWRGLGAATAAVEAPNKDHFTIIDDLAYPRSALVQALIGE